MTQEEKSLLLKDLSARLPYKVIVDYGYNSFDVHNGNYVKHGSKCILKCYLLDVFISPRQNEKGEYIKPYLRLISSMTRGEKEEFEQIRYNAEAKLFNAFSKGGFTLAFYEINDWLNAHHFDYRGLIPMKLALEAPKGMYDSNSKVN